MKKSPLTIKYLGNLLLSSLFLIFTGCQTTSDLPEGSAANPEPAKAGSTKTPSKNDSATNKKSGPDKSNDTDAGKKPIFREPDDSWTYLRIVTVDETTKDHLTRGYVAMARGEFRLILEGVDLNVKVEVSGNYGKIIVWGVNEGKWEGVLDEKTPLAMQPFFMLAQAFKIAFDSAMDSGGVKFSFRGLNQTKVEVGDVFFGPVKNGHLFPEDMAVTFEKTNMQISFIIEE